MYVETRQGQRDQVRLHEQVARELMAQQLVAVVGHGADTVHQDASACGHVAEVLAAGLVAEQARQRHGQATGQAPQGIHRGADQAVLDAREQGARDP